MSICSEFDKSSKPSTVAVVLIIYHNDLSNYERISLQQCLKVLGNYPIVVTKPESLKLDIAELNGTAFTCESFPDSSFADIGTYSRLLISREFYRRFLSYDYILVHQLDVFVFKDQLTEWCQENCDYVGAPWFEGFSPSNDRAQFTPGGNGGFSLRRVSTHLRVLNSFSYISRPSENWAQRKKQAKGLAGTFHETAGFLLDMTIRNNTHWSMNSFRGFEDQFWCLVASRNFKWFKIPSPSCSMKFAFEMQPSRVFKLNNEQLPFGCHAWWKYDLEFWRPFIESYGYRL